MGNKILSIIIPYFDETIEQIMPVLTSINNQVGVDFNDIECILVNDGNNNILDETKLKTILKVSYRVVMMKENLGPGVARQTGIDNSQSEYVMFCDADDVLHNVAILGVFFQEIIQHKPDVIASTWLEEYIDNGKYVYITHENENTWMHGKAFRRMYLKENNIRFHEGLRVHEDSYFLSLAGAFTENRRYIDAPSYVWKYRKESITRRNNGEYTLTSIPEFNRAVEMSLEVIKDRNPKIMEYKFVQYILYNYFTLHQPMWLHPFAEPHLYNAEKAIASTIEKYKKYYKNASAETINMIYNEQRKISFNAGIEKETLDQWLEKLKRIYQHEQENLQNQTVEPVEIASGQQYVLKSKTNHTLITVANANKDHGGEVWQWSDTGSDIQRWVLEAVGVDGNNEYYKLTNVASGLVLAVQNGLNYNNIKIQQEEWENKNSQKWKFELIDGYYRMSPASSLGARALDFGNGKIENGADLKIYECNNSNTQLFILNKAEPQNKPSLIDPVVAEISQNAFVENFFNFHNNLFIDDFWMNVEIMEVMIDVYERTRRDDHKEMINKCYEGFMVVHNIDWKWNTFNDDIMWMILACARAYNATGDEKYKESAKKHFDFVWDRAWIYDSKLVVDADHNIKKPLGWGLYYDINNNCKNACINGPAIIAAVLLYQIYKDEDYLQRAKDIYNWQKEMLITMDGDDNGRVCDQWMWDQQDNSYKLSNYAATYNHGTWIGACNLLYQVTGDEQYYQDAYDTAKYSVYRLCNNKVISFEGGSNKDLHGFKGIFMRWFGKFVRDNHITDFDEWLTLNAETVWNNRNSQNLMWTEWANQTRENLNDHWSGETVFGCSTAVSLLYNCLK